jgi:dienelactone hydrolase
MFVHGYTFDGWLERTGSVLDPLGFPERRMGDFLTAGTGRLATAAEWPAIRKGLIERIHWALGAEPPGAKFPNPSRPGSPSWWASEGYLGQVLPRRVQGLTASDLAFGDALKGEYYLPSGRTLRARTGAGAGAATPAGAPTPPAPGEKWPVVIWLHSESYGSGYSRYSFWAPLVGNGFAVFTFDQIGFGARSTQALNFYDRYPQWSLMGKMVADTRAAIDAVSALATTDQAHIYIAGLGLGAQVGLLTAALDNRVKGVATITGLGSIGTMNPDTEGVKRYSHLHGLMPKLGFFLGRETRLPFDFDQVLAAIAPRPVLAVAPTMDRYYPLEQVKNLAAAVEPVYRMFGRETGLEIQSPQEFSRFPNAVQKLAYDWIGALAGRPVPPKKEAGGH